MTRRTSRAWQKIALRAWIVLVAACAAASFATSHTAQGVGILVVGLLLPVVLVYRVRDLAPTTHRDRRRV